jgi:hypothetical protein
MFLRAEQRPTDRLAESQAFKPPLANIRTLAGSIDHEPAALR